MLYGLTGGLALVTLLLIFAVFNVAVDQARLLRMTPGFIHGAGRHRDCRGFRAADGHLMAGDPRGATGARPQGAQACATCSRW